MDYIFVPNFMKIRRGQDFFVDLAWNDPHWHKKVSIEVVFEIYFKYVHGILEQI